MIWWQQLLLQLGSSSIILAAAGWIVATVVNTLTLRTNERYKQELATEAQLIIEQPKHALDTATLAGKIQLESLHSKRGEVIARLYSELVDTIRDANQLVAIFEPAGMPPKIDRLKTFVESYNKMVVDFDRNRIYFNKATCDLADALIGKLREYVLKFQMFVMEEQERGKTDTRSLDAWSESWKAISTDVIPKLRVELESQFKQLLGVE